MKKLMLLLLIFSLVTSPAVALRASDYFRADHVVTTQSVLSALVSEGVVPPSAADVINSKVLESSFSATGNETRMLSFKGVLDMATLNITANDTIHINTVSFADEIITVNETIDAGNSTKICFMNVTRLFAPATLSINVNNSSLSYNYTVTIVTFPYMLATDSIVTVSPLDGAVLESTGATTAPIPVFVKPRSAEVVVSVNVYNPLAGTSDVYLNMTMESATGNVVDVVLMNVTDGIEQLDLYIDGDYVETVSVTNGVAYFNVSDFSTHTVTLIVSGALVAPQEEIDWYWVAAVVIVLAMFAWMVYLLIMTFWRKR